MRFGSLVIDCLEVCCQSPSRSALDFQVIGCLTVKVVQEYSYSRNSVRNPIVREMFLVDYRLFCSLLIIVKLGVFSILITCINFGPHITSSSTYRGEDSGKCERY